MSLVEQLVRDYDGFRLEIPRWEIADQGITALLGPSGSGKSSVVRVLLGLDACPGLRWTLAEEDLARLPVNQRRLGVVFQSLELFPHLSAEANVRFAAEARRIPAERAEPRFEQLVSALDLRAFLPRRAELLSGGERQRVALARALMGEPRFLFLDEPFTALDASLRAQARALVKAVVAKFSVPTLLITHDPEDVRELAGQTVHISQGRLA